MLTRAVPSWDVGDIVTVGAGVQFRVLGVEPRLIDAEGLEVNGVLTVEQVGDLASD
jgi:hypothetical protein